jgi:8-oxo-dGTP pyrophosphatase MutT (NUDIX family)
MGISPYLKQLRSHIGNALVLMPSVAALIRNDAGEILFQRRAEDGLWSLPGGGIDPGESPAVAIVREVREETGLHVEPLSVAGVFGGPAYRVVHSNGDVVEYTLIVYESRRLGGELGALDDETAALVYIAAARRPTLNVPYPSELFDLPGTHPTLFG